MAIAPVGAVGQIADWPGYFLPSPGRELADSSGGKIMIGQRRFEREFDSRNSISINRNTADRFVRQSLGYELTYDPYVHSFDHFLDISGGGYGKRGQLGTDYLGVEWRPTMVLTKGRESGQVEGNLEAGPTVMYSPWGIPVKVGGGLAATGWNGRLPDRLGLSQARAFVDSSDSDIGVFGELEIGGRELELRTTRVAFSAGTFARSTPIARVARTSGSALLNRVFPMDDSLFVFCSDTFAYGNEASLSQTTGRRALYQDRPTARANELIAGLGFRGRERLRISPSVAVVYTDDQIAYPGETPGFRDDLSERNTSLIGIVETQELPLAQYSGSVLLDIGVTDWRVRNREDHEALGFRMKHRLSKTFSTGLGYSYAAHAARQSRTYPEGDGDDDRVQIRHDLELSVAPRSSWEVRLFGGYSKDVVSYVRGTRSGLNMTDSSILVGVSGKLSLGDAISLRDTVGAQTTMARYHFPDVHIGDPPPYSRLVYSRLSFVWQVLSTVNLELRWLASYDDHGSWNGEQYFDTAMIDSVGRFGFYGIDEKTFEQTIRLGATVELREGIAVTAGVEYNDVYLRGWDLSRESYEVIDLDYGYRFAPSVGFRGTVMRNVLLRAVVEPVLYFEEDDGGTLTVGRKHLDFRLGLQAGL